VKKAAKTSFAKTSGVERELIGPHGDKRYVRHDRARRISESDDVGRSHSRDHRRKARKAAAPGLSNRDNRTGKPRAQTKARSRR
jgi:hypothetical protein